MKKKTQFNPSPFPENSPVDSSPELKQTLFSGPKSSSRRTTVQERAHYVDELIASGKSIIDYSRSVGINPGTLRNWVRQLKRSRIGSIDESAPRTKKFFLSKVLPGYIRLELPNGITLEFPSNALTRLRLEAINLLLEAP